ncbi:MAG: hypothetical protein GY869_19050, partial [Planctomycetes bacterium]|nr:hypothetical protein [Planctomycetota bacterium]
MKYLIISNAVRIVVVIILTVSTSRVSAEVLNVNSSIFYPTITQAVLAATSGDRLNVSTGVYSDEIEIMSIDLEIYGGYAPDCVTKISGGMSYIAPSDGPYVLNASVLFDSICVTGAVDFGLNLRGGAVVTSRYCTYSHNRAAAYGNGAGVCVRENSRLVLDGCNLQMNNAIKFGGGAFIKDNSKLILIGDPSDISENTAKNGGGIAVFDDSTFEIQGQADIQNNIAAENGGGIYATNNAEISFYGTYNLRPGVYCNTAGGVGGGFYAAGSGTVVRLSNVDVGRAGYPNKSMQTSDFVGGGGATILYGARLEASNTRFGHNRSFAKGGGVFLHSSSAFITGDTADEGGFLPVSSFVGNIATGGIWSSGGGIYSRRSKMHVENTLMTSNVTDNMGGGIHAEDYSVADLINLVVSRNKAGTFGVGIRPYSSTVTVSQCTIAYNDQSGVEFGGTTILGMTNCIVWGHTGTEVSPGLSVGYCDIEGGYATGTDNIDVDPDFIDYLAGDFRLSISSPCIESGIVLPGMSGAKDIVGNDRVTGDTVDMGAYEFPLWQVKSPEWVFKNKKNKSIIKGKFITPSLTDYFSKGWRMGLKNGETGALIDGP